MNIGTISAKDFAAVMQGSTAKAVIDVRTGAEFEGCHVKGAKLFPLQELHVGEILVATEEADEGGPIYVLCKAGGRAKQAAEKIAPETLRNVIVVEGGTDACVSAGMAVNRGREIMSLERQVRIAAGTLVMAGVALGYLVAPGFYGLAAFVGAGLTFAGITDTCAMGMMLARMPWNKAAA